MKKLILITATMIGAFLLTGCQGTNSSSSPGASASCTMNSSGQYVNSLNGTICNPSTGGTACAGQPGVVFNGTYWINQVTSQPATCNTQGLPYSNPVGGGGCQYWSQVYGVQYAPTYIGGQLYCVNLSSYGVTPPPTYNYTQPIYANTCNYGDPSCGYGWQNSYTYGVGAGFGQDYGYGSSSFFSLSFSIGF